MTEYELADAITSYAVQGGTFFTIWLTILSAYALVAYVAGSDLDAFQIGWLNTLYLFATTLAIYGFHGSFRVQVYYINLIRQVNPSSPQTMNSIALIILTGMALAGTLATLKFMWDVRHPKSE